MEKRIENTILVALKSFSENFRKETTQQLTVIWLNSLGDLSMEAILKGTRRCLTECEFYPTIKIFREKALTNTQDRGGQWKDVPQIEQTENSIPMPDGFMEKFKMLTEQMSVGESKPITEYPKPRSLIDMPVSGEDTNGMKFTLRRDAHGRDWVQYHNLSNNAQNGRD